MLIFAFLNTCSLFSVLHIIVLLLYFCFCSFGKSLLLFSFGDLLLLIPDAVYLFPFPAPALYFPHSLSHSLSLSLRQVALVAPSNSYLLRLRIVSGVSAGIQCIFIYFLLPVLWFWLFSHSFALSLSLALSFHLLSKQLYWINIFFRFSCNYKSLIEFSRLVVLLSLRFVSFVSFASSRSSKVCCGPASSV